jgi:hypothetical protein
MMRNFSSYFIFYKEVDLMNIYWDVLKATKIGKSKGGHSIWSIMLRGMHARPGGALFEGEDFFDYEGCTIVTIYRPKKEREEKTKALISSCRTMEDIRNLHMLKSIKNSTKTFKEIV